MLDNARDAVSVLDAIADKHGKYFDYADEYGEPGYNAKGDLIVFGNYWCQCDATGESYSDGTPKLHDVIAAHYPHIAERFQELGIEFEWDDEWWITHDGPSKAWRCEPDSYSWQPSAVLVDGELLTLDDDLETWIDHVANDPCMVVPANIATPDDLRGAGFRQYEHEGDRPFESGWHPGQDDDPQAITVRIREEHGESVGIVFYLDGVGQFDIAFTAWIRDSEEG